MPLKMMVVLVFFAARVCSFVSFCKSAWDFNSKIVHAFFGNAKPLYIRIEFPDSVQSLMQLDRTSLCRSK